MFGKLRGGRASSAALFFYFSCVLPCELVTHLIPLAPSYSNEQVEISVTVLMTPGGVMHHLCCHLCQPQSLLLLTKWWLQILSLKVGVKGRGWLSHSTRI